VSEGVVHVVTLVALGTIAGILGTIVGLGGGFVVVPVLRIVYGIAPATTAGISLVMVLANAVSGSFAYLRQRRADARIAGLIAITGIPASVLGTYLVGRVSFGGFDILYGAMLFYFFIDLMRRRRDPKKPPPLPVAGLHERRLVDAYGEEFRYLTSTPLILASGVALGFVSSFFGIGGGIIFVMVFIAMFRMPPHIVTATSTLAILLTSPAGVISHAVAHDIDWAFAVPLAAGGLMGGQLGPRIARRLSSTRLLSVLAMTVLLAALALILKHVPIHV
jgi:uncharacterized membrane protein YfcA